MKRTRKTAGALSLPTLTLEGGLFLPDQLEKAALGVAQHQTEADYAIPKGLKLKDEYGRAFQIACAEWKHFAVQMERADLDTAAITQNFVRELLRDAFGYTQIQPVSDIAVADRRYPVSLLAGQVPIVVAPHPLGLDEADPRFAVMANGEWRVANGKKEDHSPLAIRHSPTSHSPLATRHSATKGNARKLTGSYYTPDSLVQELIQSALDPVIEQRLSEAGRMANSEWSMVSPQYREVFIHYANPKLPESGGLAARAQTGHGNLSVDRSLPDERAVWADRPDEAGGGVDSEQHCGRMGAALSGGVHSVPQNRQREQGRIGDTTDFIDRSGVQHGDRPNAAVGTNHDSRQTATVTGTPLEGANGEWRTVNGENSDHSPLTTRYSRLWEETPSSIRHSLFATHALLSLRVIDPACGSGHFLLAAARRLAEKLAQLQSPEGAVTPQDYRHALREVVARCIFGVDRNPMALELARTALWLEGYEEGRPLSFLDHHLQCGDALLGLTDLKALEQGIAKDAYKPLSGDDKDVCKRLAKANAVGLKQLERDLKGKQTRLRFDDADSLAALQILEALPENSTQDIAAKETAYRDFLQQAKESRLAHAADLLLGAYLLPKTANGEDEANSEWRMANGGEEANGIHHSPFTIHHSPVPTSATLYLALLTDTLDAGHRRQLAAAQAVCREARVLHWPLAFPQVFATGGFDCVLGNPPWERIKLQEEEFFATRHRHVAEAKNKAERAQRIQWLSEGMLARHLYPQMDHPPHECEAEQRLYAEFIGARRTAEAASLFAHVKGEDGGRYPLTGVGDVNTYALFAETINQITAPRGRAGFIVPTGIATDDSTKAYFANITQAGRLVSLYDIENREAVFEDVHRSYKFCLLTLGAAEQAEFVCFATQVDQLKDSRRRFRLTPDEFRLINPNTLTCPVFRSERDAELTKKLYRAAPVLIEEGQPDGNPWGISFMRMLDMANDSHLFADAPSPGLLPLYEAKMIHQFDHRWASYGSDGNSGDVTLDDKNDPSFTVTPRYWVSEAEVEQRLSDKNWSRGWLMGWRDICRATDERTAIASVVPRVGVGHTMPLFMTTAEPMRVAALLGNFGALVLDFIARVKVGGTHLTYSCLKQFPFIPPDRYTETDLAFIVPRVLELTYTAHDLQAWAEDLVSEWGAANGEWRMAGVAGMANGEWRIANGKKEDRSPLATYRSPSSHSPLTIRHSPENPLAIRHSPLTPFPFDPERRAHLRAELDAYYARLYGLTRDELRYILHPADVMGEDYPSETFRVLKNNEVRAFGEYRTQRLVLAAWDRLEKGELS